MHTMILEHGSIFLPCFHCIIVHQNFIFVHDHSRSSLHAYFIALNVVVIVLNIQ